MPRRTSSKQHIPNMGYVDQSNGVTPTGKTPSAWPGIMSTRHILSIPDLSSQHEGQTVFAMATSHSSQERLGVDALRYGIFHPLMQQPPLGHESRFISPSPYWDGCPLVSSTSLPKAGSTQRGSTQQVDPMATPPPSGETTGHLERAQWPINDHTWLCMLPEVSPPLLSTE
jgi:hypothetical protein